MTTGEKIRIQRQMKNYSQIYMAFMLEISQAAYSNIERDATDLTLRRIYEIAEILQISPFVLMPPPKYGSGINFHAFLHTLYKLKRFWTNRLEKRKAEALRLNIVYSDIHNSDS